MVYNKISKGIKNCQENGKIIPAEAGEKVVYVYNTHTETVYPKHYKLGERKVFEVGEHLLYLDMGKNHPLEIISGLCRNIDRVIEELSTAKEGYSPCIPAQYECPLYDACGSYYDFVCKYTLEKAYGEEAI